jgi:hypothetical protein
MLMPLPGLSLNNDFVASTLLGSWTIHRFGPSYRTRQAVPEKRRRALLQFILGMEKGYTTLFFPELAGPSTVVK